MKLSHLYGYEQELFPIIQGSVYDDLSEMRAQIICLRTMQMKGLQLEAYQWVNLMKICTELRWVLSVSKYSGFQGEILDGSGNAGEHSGMHISGY